MTKQFLQSPPSNTHKLGEFELIRDIFKTRAEQMMKAKPQHAPLLGIGDDGDPGGGGFQSALAGAGTADAGSGPGHVDARGV